MDKREKTIFVFSAFLCAMVLNSFTSPEAIDPSKEGYVFIENEKDLKLHKLSREYGFLFFFKKDCAVCEEFALVVKSFCDKYRWNVMAISETGEKHDVFARSEKDNGLIKQWDITEYPVLFAVNPKKELATKIALTAIPIEELEDRVIKFLNNTNGFIDNLFTDSVSKSVEK